MINGKGIFIWKGAYCGPNPKGNTVQAAVDACQLMGLGHVVLKIGDAAGNHSQSYQDMAGAVRAFRDAGISVWLWHYIYGGVWWDKPGGVVHTNGASPELEADFALKAIRELRPDGYVIDAEKEFKTANPKARARRFMDRLGKPGVPVAFSSYRYPRYHPELPWMEFLNKCDLHMPQAYWGPGGAVNETIESITQCLALRQLPVVATGRAYIGDGHANPRPEELTRFMDTAFGMGVLAVNFWALDFLYSHIGGPLRADAIRAYQISGSAAATEIAVVADQVIAEPVKPTYRVTALSLRVRSMPGMDASTVGWLWKGNRVTPLQVRDLGPIGVWAELEPHRWAAVSWKTNKYMEKE